VKRNLISQKVILNNSQASELQNLKKKVKKIMKQSEDAVKKIMENKMKKIKKVFQSESQKLTPNNDLKLLQELRQKNYFQLKNNQTIQISPQFNLKEYHLNEELKNFENKMKRHVEQFEVGLNNIKSLKTPVKIKMVDKSFKMHPYISKHILN
jgi:hypothetical protein